MSKRVAVIGLDGMAWHILHRLFTYDAMPNLRKISEKSLKGVLKSTFPPCTPPAWTSIATGVNPGKHGVFGFITLNENYETRLVTSSEDVKYPRIHEMLALKGLKTVCINQPLTYPIIKISKNCQVLSDWLGPKLTYYPEKLEKYAKNYPLYDPKILERGDDESLEILYEDTEKRVETVNQMMEELDWNLFWVIYSVPDGLFHKYYEDVLKGRKSILRIFKSLDKTFEEANKLADLTLVVSDHGFCKYDYVFNINVFLEKLNLITKTRKRTLRNLGDFGRFKKPKPIRYIPIPPKLYSLFSLKPIKKTIKKIYKTITGKDIRAQLLIYVDPFKSKAFAKPDFDLGVHVNDEKVLETILSELEKLEFITHVWKREEVYQGPYTNKAPNIIFTPDFDHGFSYDRTNLISSQILVESLHYNHHPDGIIIASSDEIKPKEIGEIQTHDIVPTILNYLELPLPANTDGTPLIGKPSQKRYDYLKHWKLIKKIQTVKTKLARTTKT